MILPPKLKKKPKPKPPPSDQDLELRRHRRDADGIVVAPVRRESKRPFDDDAYQDALVAQVCRDRSTLDAVGDLLSVKDFEPLSGRTKGDAMHRWVLAELALSHFAKYREPIGPLVRSEALAYAKTANLSDAARQDLIQYVDALNQRDLVGVEAVIDKVRGYKRDHAIAAAIEELIDLHADGKLDDGKLGEITDRMCHTARKAVAPPMTAADLVNTDFPEPVFHLNNVMPRGLTLLAARPKVGKSWMALQLAIATAFGKPFLGRKVKSPGKVLFVALEDGPQRIKERLCILLPELKTQEDTSIPLGKIRFLHELPPLEAGGLGYLGGLLEKEAATGEPFTLLVVDHWLAASGERKGNDIVRGEYKEVAALRHLATDHKVAVVVIHHLRKMIAVDAGEMVIGTTGVTAAVDSYWIIAPGSDDQTKKLEIRGRDIRERTLAIQFKTTGSTRGWRVIEEGVEVQAGPVGKEILRHLKSGGPQTPKQIAEALNRPANAIYENIHRLRKQGRVLKTGGKYAYPTN